VAGTMTMHWAGSGVFNNSQVTEDTTLTNAVLSGSPSDPVLDGTLVGEVTVDGQTVVGGAAGNGTHVVRLHLHITHVTCQAINGDADAMLEEIVAGEATIVGGSAIWTATR
jgi:hypothetical protein